MRAACVAGRKFCPAGAMLIASLLNALATGAGNNVAVIPDRIELRGNFARAQLLVARAGGDGLVNERSADLTPQAKYESSDNSIVTVSETGQLCAVANGQAKVVVVIDGSKIDVPVTVEGIAKQPQVGFSQSIRPTTTLAWPFATAHS